MTNLSKIEKFIKKTENSSKIENSLKIEKFINDRKPPKTNGLIFFAQECIIKTITNPDKIIFLSTKYNCHIVCTQTT